MKLSRCPHCSREIPDSARQCDYCGAVIERDEKLREPPAPSADKTAKVARPSTKHGAEKGAEKDGSEGAAEWIESSQDLLAHFLEEHTTGVPPVGDPATGAIPLEEYDDAPVPTGSIGAPGGEAAIPEPTVDPGARYTDSQLRRIAFLRSRLAQAGADPRTLQNLGRVHEEAGDPAAALHYYRICLEADPSTPYAAERAPLLELELEHRGGLLPSARTTGVASAAPSTGAIPLTEDLASHPATRSAALPRTGTRSADVAPRTGETSIRDTRTTDGRSTGASTPRRRASRPIQRRRRPSKAVFTGLLVLAALYGIAAGVLLARYAAPADRAVGTPGHGAAEVAFSADGRLLAFIELPAQIDAPGIQWGQWEGGSGAVQIHDLEKRTTVRTIDDARIPPLGPSLSWGGGRLAYSARDGRVAVVDLAKGGAEVVRVEGSRPSLSADGKRLAFDRFVTPEAEEAAEGVRHVLVLDIASGEERVVDELGGRRPSFSPRGDRIAFEHAGRIYVAPSEGGAAAVVASSGGDHSPSWVAGGSLISWLRRDAVARRDRSVIEDRLWVARPDGSEAHEILSFEANDAVALSTAHWSSDGSLVLFARIGDGRAGLVVHPERGLTPGGLEARVDLAFRDLEESLTYPVRASAVPGLRGNPVLSPDGRTLAYTVLIDGVPQLRVSPWVDADPR